MLVLSRKIGQCVQIGDCIEVKVLELNGSRVKLGFTAPANMNIQRNEIRDAYPRGLASWGQSSAVVEFCNS